jgi:hypothetical protein
VAACLFARRPGRRELELETALGDAVVASSLRSGFELLLEALALPAGSEVLVSAVTHPDMVRVLERHALVAVAVDLDLATMSPLVTALEDARTPRTRAVLVAHLFGSCADLDETIAFARRHGLLVLEDCAQAFRGPGDRGDERCDVTMFSFGSIKTCTALGGGIVYVRLPGVAAQMRDLRRTWPRQSRREYLARTLRFSALQVLAVPIVYGLFVRAAERAGRDADSFVNSSVRALKPPQADAGDPFATWLRRRPSAPLLALLAHRLATFDAGRLERRAGLGDSLTHGLPPALTAPGTDAPERTHWVFPVVSPNPPRLLATLRREGFDAARATSSITAVGAPPPERAAALMRDVVFVPAYPELPPRAVRRLASALVDAVEA